jgi:RHS repeat-associated protein
MDEGITEIHWTVTNKVKEIEYTSGKRIVFDYNPMGNRIAKKVYQNTTLLSATFYALDAQGNTMNVYTFDEDDEKLYLSERNIYGSSRIGQERLKQEMTLNPPGNGSNYMAMNESGDKYYELSNHLGNVLNVVTDRKIPVENGTSGIVAHYDANVMSYSDYYPFGMVMPGRDGGTSGRYGFQGQESDPEIKGEGNSVNFKYRMHDPRIGRFFAIDPLAAKYPHYTPYSFSGNKVIAYKELEGKEEEVAFIQVPAIKGTLTLPSSAKIYLSQDEHVYTFHNEDGSLAYSKTMPAGRVYAFELIDDQGNIYTYGAHFAGSKGEGRFLGYTNTNFSGRGVGPDGVSNMETIVAPSNGGSANEAALVLIGAGRYLPYVAAGAFVIYMATLTDLSDGIQLNINLEIPPPGEWLQMIEVSPTTIPILLAPPSMQGPLFEHIEITPENIIIHQASTPKAKDLDIGDIVPTPETHPEDFSKVKGGREWTRNETEEIYSKSHTSHKGDKWKVWPKGHKGREKTPDRRSVGEDGTIKGN